jgi:predicted permease
MEHFWHDMLHAARALIKHRGYSAFAILTLGLGIGANVGMFRVFGWLLSPKLSVPRSLELVEIDRQSTSMQPSGRGLSWSMYREYVNAQPNALPELAAYYPILVFQIGNGNKTVSATVTAVTGNYFGQLQVHAFRGRVINEQDDSPNGGGDVVVLSHRCWRELFGGRDEALGTELRVNETAYTIIGVAPPTFTGIDPDPEISPDIWIPLSRVSRAPLFRMMMSDVTSATFRVFGRMKQGASVFQAREQMKAVAGQLGSGKSQMTGLRNIGKRTVPYYWEKPWPDIQLIDGHRQEDAHKFSLVLFGIVGSILILVAGNVTTILLARTERQRREFAIRIALGASRWRIARGILMESFIVAALGTVVGLIFAFLFIRLMVGLTSEITRWHETIATGVFDGRVLAFGFGIAALVAGGFSLVPMVRAGSSSPRLAMQMTTATGTSGRTSTTFRNLLTVFQTATSVVLLAFTLLLLQSAWNKSGAVFNFDTQSVWVISWNLPGVPSGSDAERSFQNAFVERVKNLPGAPAVALCNPCRLGASFNIPGWYDSVGITPEYFGVANTPILQGRNFTNQDGKSAPLVGIINLKMARQLWPREDPIGKRLEHSRWDDSTVEIVGVVADTRKEGRGEPENAILYRPLDQASTDAIRTFPVIRTDGRSLNLSALERAAREINSNVTISKMQTVADHLADTTRDLRLGALALVACAMIAVTLTVVGLYGLLSYIASAQTRDLGVRLALGAPRTSVLLLMLKRGVLPALLGVIIGLIAEAACPNIFSGALYGVGMHDIPTLMSVALAMFCVAIAASWIPSWRASRLNPIEALREE